MKNITAFIFSVAVLFILYGCGQLSTPNPQPPVIYVPKVVYMSPTIDATSIAINLTIEAQFNNDINPLTVNDLSFLLASPEGSVSGVVTYDALSKTVSLKVSNLTYNKNYGVTLKKTIADITGVSMESDYTWSFSTVDPGAPPNVISVFPTNHSTMAALSLNIDTKFDKDIDPATVTSTTFLLASAEGSVTGVATYNSTLRKAYLIVTELINNTTYTAEATTGIKDTFGNPLANSYRWNFVTLPPTISPHIISIYPVNGATAVPISVTLEAQFDKDMNSSTISSSTFLLSSAEGSVSCAITYESSSKKAKAAVNNLAYSTTYIATVTAGVKDTGGISLDSASTWLFTTAADPWHVGITIDNSAAVGNSSSLAVDKTDNKKIHFAYYDVTNKTLKYAFYNSGAVQTKTIDNVPVVPLGADNNITLLTDSNNKIHIIYYANSALKYASCDAASSISGTWSVSTVDASVLGSNSAVIDANNKIYICYYDNNKHLKYATNASGDWVLTVVDSTSADTGQYNSIAVDNSGNAYISYFDVTNNAMRYATNRTGAWVKTTIGISAGQGQFGTSIAVNRINGANIICVAYEDFYSSSFAKLKLATSEAGSGTWTNTQIDSALGASLGGYPYLALDGNNNIYVVHGDWTNSKLRYTNNYSGPWSTNVIDSSSTFQQRACIVCDSSNNVHIVYLTSGGVKYATNAN